MSEMVERRYDIYGVWRFMIEAEGYVMARRPRCAPRVFSRKEWDELPRKPVARDQ